MDKPLSVIFVVESVPASVRLPALVSELFALKKFMLPVEPLPSWRVWKLVVPRIPVAVREAAPVVPETEAVGVPPATLITANLAELVAVPPISRSRVELPG